jgi:hypothetical protein
MDVHVACGFRAGVDELVWHVRRHNYNLTCACFNRGIANSKRKSPLLHNKDLLIGVFVQGWSLPWRGVVDEKGNAYVSVKIAFELPGCDTGWQFLCVHDGYHISS